MEKRVQVTTYVAADVAERLEAVAKEQDRSLASLLRLALYEVLEREEQKEAV